MRYADTLEHPDIAHRGEQFMSIDLDRYLSKTVD
jgi:hypothetical protein